MTRVRVTTVACAALAVVLGWVGWAAVAPFPEGSRDLTYVIPPGTAARLKSGEPFSVLPSPIHLTLGVRDVLMLINDDEVIHQVGPIILGPRQAYRISFRRSGHYQYACSLHAAGTLNLVISPEPAAGLARSVGAWTSSSPAGRAKGSWMRDQKTCHFRMVTLRFCHRPRGSHRSVARR